jgi:hypothetical protein
MRPANETSDLLFDRRRYPGGARTPSRQAGRRQGRRGAAFAPLWALTYADLMSLLLVLFAFVHALQGAPVAGRLAARSGGQAAAGWQYLGRLPVAAGVAPAATAGSPPLDPALRARLAADRSRVALAGIAAEPRAAFAAALEARNALAAEGFDPARFLVVARACAGRRDVVVEAYATEGK